MNLPLPYTVDNSPWHDGKQVAVIRGFLDRYTTIGLELPTPVADAVTAFTAATGWARNAAPDADEARHNYRQAVITAARSGAPEPDLDAVVTAVARDQAHSLIRRDLADISATLHADVITATINNLDAMIQNLAEEHDRLLSTAREHAERLPASVRDADGAVSAGAKPAAAWAALADTGTQLTKVRAARHRIGVIDHPPGSGDYLLWRRPDRLPPDHPAGSNPALVAIDLVVDPHGAEPWCPTRDELAAHVEQRAAAAAVTRRGPESRTGRYGPPPIWDTAS